MKFQHPLPHPKGHSRKKNPENSVTTQKGLKQNLKNKTKKETVCVAQQTEINYYLNNFCSVVSFLII